MIVTDNYTSGPYSTPWTQLRNIFYGPGEIPKVYIDGLVRIAGDYGSPASNAAQYRQAINARLSETGGLAPVRIDGWHSISPSNIIMQVAFTLDEPVTLDDPTVVLQVLEDNTATDYDHLVRAVHEEAVTLLNQGDHVDVNISVPINGAWVLDNLEMVAFMYSSGGSKEVYQSARIPKVDDFAFAFDRSILSLPLGHGTAEFTGTLVNVGEQTDTLTIELDNTFDWPAEFMVAGEPGFHTTPTVIALDPSQEVQVYLHVMTNDQLRIGEGALVVSSGNTSRVQTDHARLFNGSPAIFVVEDDGWRDNELAVYGALTARGYLYDNWAVHDEQYDLTPRFVNMDGYDLALWHQGAEASGLDPEEELALMAFMDTGGCVILSSQDYISYPHSSAFQEDYLGVAGYDSNIGEFTQVNGVSGDPISSEMAFDFWLPYLYMYRPDDLTPNAIGTAFLESEEGHRISIRGDNGIARSALLAFCLNGLDGYTSTGPWPDTGDLLDGTIRWLLAGLYQYVDAEDHAPAPDPMIRCVSPNPFTPASTTGRVSIHLDFSDKAAREPVSLRVMDQSGRLVRNLLEGTARAGAAHVFWNGRDERNRPVNAGIYHVQCRTVYGMHTGQIVVVR